MTPEAGQEVFNNVISLLLTFYIYGLTFGFVIKLFKSLWEKDND